MLTRKELLANVQGKLKDAEILYNADSYDSSYYLCGYAVELALKARIVQYLKWPGIPEKTDPKDLKKKVYEIIKTHDLDYLLHLTGRHTKIKVNLQGEWSTVLDWGPELRYKHSVKSRVDAEAMLTSARRLVKVLNTGRL